MKAKSLSIFLVAFALGGNHWLYATDTNLSGTVQSPRPQLPKRVGPFGVSAGLLNTVNNQPTIEKQLELLSGVVTNSAVEANNEFKCSALRLLGVIAKTNSVDLLVANVGYADARHSDFPAIQALVNIGEPSVSPLLHLVESSTNKRDISCAVQALKRIKGEEYEGFVAAKKGKMAQEKWAFLVRYAVDW